MAKSGYANAEETTKLAITRFHLVFEFGTKYIWNHHVNTFQMNICFTMISMIFLENSKFYQQNTSNSLAVRGKTAQITH